jgi:hypothetical protein
MFLARESDCGCRIVTVSRLLPDGVDIETVRSGLLLTELANSSDFVSASGIMRGWNRKGFTAKRIELVVQKTTGRSAQPCNDTVA